jgi:hypothetical protein
MTRTKEEIYDQDIHPYIAKILDICKEHGIAMVMAMDISSPERDRLTMGIAQGDQNGVYRGVLNVMYESLADSIDHVERDFTEPLN